MKLDVPPPHGQHVSLHIMAYIIYYHGLTCFSLQKAKEVLSLQKSKNHCCAPLYEECPQHHGHKGDPGVTPRTCAIIGERGPK